MSVKCIPLKLHFYLVKLGYTGVYIFFLFLLQNIDCGYSQVPTINVLSKNIRNSICFKMMKFFLLKISMYTAWACLHNDLLLSVALRKTCILMFSTKFSTYWAVQLQTMGCDLNFFLHTRQKISVYPRFW